MASYMSVAVVCVCVYCWNTIPSYSHRAWQHQDKTKMAQTGPNFAAQIMAVQGAEDRQLPDLVI